MSETLSLSGSLDQVTIDRVRAYLSALGFLANADNGDMDLLGAIRRYENSIQVQETETFDRNTLGRFPPSDEQIMLLRDTLSAFNHANITNNYSVMQLLASPSFRAGNTAEHLALLFAEYRVNKVNLAPILYINPILSRAAEIEKGRLRLVGSFPSKPMAVKFDLEFEFHESVWQIFSLSVIMVRV